MHLTELCSKMLMRFVVLVASLAWDDIEGQVDFLLHTYLIPVTPVTYLQSYRFIVLFRPSFLCLSPARKP